MDKIRETYTRRRLRYSEERRLLARRHRVLSNVRLVLFLIGLTALVWGLRSFESPEPPWIAAGVVALACFLPLVVIHDRVITARGRADELVAIQEDGIARLDRRWDDIRRRPATSAAHETAETTDLDVHGTASLWQLASDCWTQPGVNVLGSWLSSAASAEEIAERHVAVAELSPRIDLRHEAQYQGRVHEKDPATFDALLDWAEEEPWYPQITWLVWLPRFLAVAAVTMLVLALAGIVSWRATAVLLICNLIFSYLAARDRFHRSFDRASEGKAGIGGYEGLFGILSNTEFQSPRLRRLRDELAAGESSAKTEMSKLRRLVDLADIRRSMMHLPLQALTLWDFHVHLALDRWRLRNGMAIRSWMMALGDYEALSSLAGLAHDHPHWTMPRVVESERTFQAKGIAHPLLSPEKAVANDVQLGPPGSFLLVTGSNMSGKSTLLRSIGLNAVLAEAGGPVAAKSILMPPLVLGTSFRIGDSVVEGVSFFLAELQRLETIIRRGAAMRDQGRMFLYLLDEILLGTNIVERQVAVREVIRQLIESRTIGAIATHDLTLAGAEELAGTCRAVHFRESFEKRDGETMMTFDFTLREGVAPTTNALRLLEMVGIRKRSDSS